MNMAVVNTGPGVTCPMASGFIVCWSSLMYFDYRSR